MKNKIATYRHLLMTYLLATGLILVAGCRDEEFSRDISAAVTDSDMKKLCEIIAETLKPPDEKQQELPSIGDKTTEF